MEIKRDLYLNKLIERKNNGLIKVITGVYRCGKSYLLNTLFYNHLKSEGVNENHIIKFAFDSNADLKLIGEDIATLEKEKRKVDPNKFMEYIQSKIVDNETYYLLLDEVQLLGCFELVLNSYLYMNNVDAYVTGSNAKFLSKDIITEFAGRGDEIHMYPLSFAEFMSVYKGDKYECKCGKSYEELIKKQEHNYSEYEIILEPSEYNKGYKQKKCQECNNIILEEIEKLAHTHNYNNNCYDNNNHYQKCECGEIQNKEEHIYNEGEEIDNTITYTCTQCGYKKTEIIKNNDVIVTKDNSISYIIMAVEAIMIIGLGVLLIVKKKR